jgi:tetratricopeptide (TPR) repeat protein
MKVFGSLAALVILLIAGTAASREIPGYPSDLEAADPREVALLPRYCAHTLVFRTRVPGGNDVDAIKYWTASMGPTFNAMHHYCWGLMNTNRALLLSNDRRTKAFYLRSSIAEFDYVITRAPADFVLLPEILTKKAENLIHLGDGPAAAAILEKVIDLRKDYWPAYAALSDYYQQLGDSSKARHVLERGLEPAPGSKALQRRLDALSAKKP